MKAFKEEISKELED